MSELQDYKCPCCGGKVEFDSNLQKMKCPYCDSVFEVGQFESGKNWKKSDRTWEDPNLRTYVCQSCGGEVIGDATLGASACPYCGNPIVMKDQFAGILKPDYVLPFQLDKKKAMSIFRETLGKKKLLSRSFRNENHISGIKGIYVPVWLFDSRIQGECTYKATKIRTWSDSRFNYTETSHYSLVRGGIMDFTNIPEDGSTKMDDTLMESVGPFDFSQAVDFQSAYLSGYLADRYNVKSDDMLPRVHEITEGSLKKRLYETTGFYTTKTLINSKAENMDKEPRYALYPVWLLTTKWKDKTYLFGVNGQTGKFAGNLPLGKGLFTSWLFGLTAATALPLSALLILLLKPYETGNGYGTLIAIASGIGFIASLITVLVMKSKLKMVRALATAGNYEVGNSFKLTVQKDIFLFRNVSKTPRSQNSGGGRGPGFGRPMGHGPVGHMGHGPGGHGPGRH